MVDLIIIIASVILLGVLILGTICFLGKVCFNNDSKELNVNQFMCNLVGVFTCTALAILLMELMNDMLTF